MNLDAVRRVEAIFDRHANRPFLIDSTSDGEVWTFERCRSRAARIAEEIAERGGTPGSRILIDLPNGIDFALTYFGCLLARVVAVPVNNTLPPDQRMAVEDASGACLVRHALAGAGTGVWSVRDGGRDAEPIAVKSGRLPFTVHFTSGTTNEPKGVVHAAHALLDNAEAFNRRLDISPDDRFAHLFSMAYMAGFLNTLLVPFAAGASVVVAPVFGARSGLRFWRDMASHDATVLWTNPTMLASILKFDRGDSGVNFCRDRSPVVLSATAPLPPSVRASFEERYRVPVFESYGLSELLIVSVDGRRDVGPAGTVGVPLDVAQVQLEPRTSDSAEIAVRTRTAMLGYLTREAGRVSVATPDDWFQTGDTGSFVGTRLAITGRIKDIIIRGGLNLSPRSIEEVLLGHPAVENVAVVGVMHKFYGEEPVAVLQLVAGERLDDVRSALEALCTEHLAKESVPARFVDFGALPIGPTGKVLKREILERIGVSA